MTQLLIGYLDAIDFTAESDVRDARLAPSAMAQARADCERFFELSGECSRQAGIDFWLTRNGHGAGFWNGDWGADGDRLTAIVKLFPPVDAYLGDDGMVYFS